MTAKEKSQPDKFKEAARELECDDDEKHFDRKLSGWQKRNLKRTPKAKNELPACQAGYSDFRRGFVKYTIALFREFARKALKLSH